jgi:hypothetical protein
MASTLEMFVATVALLVNTFVIMLLYFIGNITLGPIVNFAGKYFNTSAQQAIPMWDITYIPSAIFSLLLIFEIVIIISFVVVVGRRTVVDDLY